MKRFTIAVIMVVNMLVIISTAYALEKKSINRIDADQLTEDTQVYASCGDNHFNLVWWIPCEFWQVTFANDKSTPESEKKKIINVFKPYSLLAICQADISDFGAFRFYSKDEIEKNLVITLKRQDGKTYKLTPLKNINPDVAVMISSFKPILAAAMGNLGQNLHFFVLKDYDSSNARKIDPYRFGTLEFQLRKRTGELIEAILDFPLNSLYISRKCPNGKNAHVTWKYCPWTGKKLED